MWHWRYVTGCAPHDANDAATKPSLTDAEIQGIANDQMEKRSSLALSNVIHCGLIVHCHS